MNISDERASFIHQHLQHEPVANAAIFNTMRILKSINPGDTYLDHYHYHYQHHGKKFVDYYHLLWQIGSNYEINTMLEIGCRTGISICQLLSSMISYQNKEVHLFDMFDDGFISPSLIKVNLQHLGIPTEIVNYHKGDSLIEIPTFKQNGKKFDYILVDGNHDKAWARQDLRNVCDMLNPGGFLFFDDIAPGGCNLLDVWQEFVVEHNNQFNFLHNLDGKGIGIGVKK